MNWQKRFFWMFGAVICLFVMTATMAWAYFDRGPVKVTAAQNSVSVAVGKSTTVSISTSPSSDDQLPGCGMAECPQICGEKNCLDENGECTCNGTEYKTYYTDVTTASSNSSVAKASYNNGVLTITGVSAGEADVTVTAALRQYTSTTQTIHVTVSGGNTASTDKKETTVKTPNKGEIEVVKEQPKEDTAVITVGEAEQPEQSDTAVEDNAEDIPSENTGEEENRYSVDSDRGLIHFVAIQDGLMGKDDLAAVQGKDEKVVFQKKDASETILYSWEFYGEDISTAEDLDFAINTETQLPENVADLVKGDALYLDFAQEGALPGSATINVQVGDTFATDAMLTLYYYHEDNQELELVADQLQIENGYVAFQLDHCSAYVLTAGPLAAESALAWWVILIIAVVVVAIIVIVVWNKKKKSVA